MVLFDKLSTIASNGNFTNISSLPANNISSVPLQYIRSGCLILCMSGGFFINVLFIVIVSKTRNFHRRSLFGLCLNLACIFFLDIFINQLLTLISSINESWIFTDVICIAQSFSINIVDTCLSLTLFMLGIDRLIAVKANVEDKIKLAKGLNKDAIALSILCLWLLSICFSIPLVTKTISSKYIPDKYSCCASIKDNLIYRISLFCFTIGFPLFCVAIMYAYIAQIWISARKDIIKVSLSYTLNEKFQIEKEVNNSICTFAFHLAWVLVVGPYLSWLYLSLLIPETVLVILVWLRNFYCWLPFFVIVACHKSFRTKLTSLINGYPNGQSVTNGARNTSSNDDIDPSCGGVVGHFQDNTFSTNLAFSDCDINNNHQSRQPGGCPSEYGNSSRSFSYSSSAVSDHLVEYLPKVPVMFATGSGVHVINEYFPKISESANRGERRSAAQLCDVHEAGFTDTSDAVSLTASNSFKVGRQINPLFDIKPRINLPNSFAHELYNHRGRQSRPQLNFEVNESGGSTFQLPKEATIEKIENTERRKRKVRKKKPPATTNSDYHLPQLYRKSAISEGDGISNQNLDSIDLEMDIIGATNA